MTNYFRLGLLLTSLAIALNAMGYHALQPRLTVQQLSLFETASRYSILGGIWLMILGLASSQMALSKKGTNLIAIGLLLFCGSLFAYIVFPIKALMILTPLGGASMIIGFLLCALKKK